MFCDGFSAQSFLHSPGSMMLHKSVRIAIAAFRKVQKVLLVLLLIFTLY